MSKDIQFELEIYNWQCINCGVTPKMGWLYGPGDDFYCDNCVPRGCTCNSELKEGIENDSEEAKDPANYYQRKDEDGREPPCCEFWYGENKFDMPQVLPEVRSRGGYIKMKKTDNEKEKDELINDCLQYIEVNEQELISGENFDRTLREVFIEGVETFLEQYKIDLREVKSGKYEKDVEAEETFRDEIRNGKKLLKRLGGVK